MACLRGSHAGSALPGMESTPVQRTTDSSFVGQHYANLGQTAAEQVLEGRWKSMDEMLNELCSKETIDSFGFETQIWTEQNTIKLRERLILAIKENYDTWNEGDPELAFEVCRDYVQDILLDDQLERSYEASWLEDTSEQDDFTDALLYAIAEGAARQREWFAEMSELTAQVDRDMRNGPPTTPRLTTVEPTLPPPPPIKLRHTRNVCGDFGMYVNTDTCNCSGCREYRGCCDCPACDEMRADDGIEMEDIVNQYRW